MHHKGLSKYQPVHLRELLKKKGMVINKELNYLKIGRDSKGTCRQLNSII